MSSSSPNLSFLAASKDGSSTLAVRLTPHAGLAAVTGLWQDEQEKTYIKISVSSPPTEGQANAALIKFLSKTLDLPLSSFSIITGLKGRKKLILIGAPFDATLKKVKEHLCPHL